MIFSTLVVNISLKNLLTVGLSEYEAKAYTALLENNPATAYEIAKSSGIPTSKVYEVIARLMDKRIVSALGEERTKRYIPMDAHEFVQAHRMRLEATLNSLEEELKGITRSPDVSYIWNIGDYEYLMDKAERIILGAHDTLLISGWKEELEFLEGFLKIADVRLVRIAVIHFGRTSIKTGQVFQHPREDTIYAEKGGRGLVIVADSREVLMGTISSDGSVEGATSMNRGFVTLAEDYVKHDIYIMKTFRRFDRDLRRTFGDKYEYLRDIFSDDEA